MENEYVYIGYGIGCNYKAVSKQVKEKILISYLCDKKWDSSVTVYDDIPVINLTRITELKNSKVVIFPIDITVQNAIAKELKNLGIQYIFVDELLGRRIITGKEIKEEGNDGIWEDSYMNKIYYHNSIPDEVIISLNGTNSKVIFDENININKLIIHMGNEGTCKIGANTRILGVTMFVAYALLSIGKDCLFSADIYIRTHDGHAIFDRNTHKRINIPKDVILHDHVWIGEGSVLLPGANIGEGSILGTKMVTSSSFGDHVIIAGVPGKVVRKDICWSKDSTEYLNYSFFEECVTDDAMRYS